MFMVTTIALEGGAMENAGWLFLEMALAVAWLITAFALARTASVTTNPDTKFGCMAGLYGCYIVFAAVMFIFVTPISVGNMVESGFIAMEDTSLYTAIIISITFAIWNIIGLVAVICWHFTKKRKERSEMERMKLEDL